MFIYHSPEEAGFSQNTVLTLGTFDGLHKGHLEILKKVSEKKHAVNGRSMVVTFTAHPRRVLGTDTSLLLLNSLDEKLDLFRKSGIDAVLLLEFTTDFAQQSAEEFVNNYFVKGTGVTEIVVGHDHHFGKGRDGNLSRLREIGEKFNFGVTVVDALRSGDEIISSTAIRKALQEGNLPKAASFLGRLYCMQGRVVEGDKRARKLGFPTANLELLYPEKLMPKNGVYAVRIQAGEKEYEGIMNTGKRPTFGGSLKEYHEAHLFDFSGDLYGKVLTVHFVKFIRNEQKFSSVDELVEQVRKDILYAKGILQQETPVTA